MNNDTVAPKPKRGLYSENEALEFVFSHSNKQISDISGFVYQTVATHRWRFKEGIITSENKRVVLERFGFTYKEHPQYRYE